MTLFAKKIRLYWALKHYTTFSSIAHTRIYSGKIANNTSFQSQNKTKSLIYRMS